MAHFKAEQQQTNRLTNTEYWVVSRSFLYFERELQCTSRFKIATDCKGKIFYFRAYCYMGVTQLWN